MQAQGIDVFESSPGSAYDNYLNDMARHGTWGTEAEVLAAAELYGRHIHVIMQRHSDSTVVYNPLPNAVPDLRGPIVIVFDATAEHYQVMVPDKRKPAATKKAAPKKVIKKAKAPAKKAKAPAKKEKAPAKKEKAPAKKKKQNTSEGTSSSQNNTVEQQAEKITGQPMVEEPTKGS
jgi:hypothetical protein